MLQQIWRILGLDFESKIRKQQNKNLAVISKLIEGHYEIQDSNVREASKKAFREWMIWERKLWQGVGTEVRQRLEQTIKKNAHHQFKWGALSEKLESPVFIADAFTEPFPSTHDMDDWALSTKMAELLIAHGVKVSDAKSYKIFIKHHYVNHSMVQGIIQFDVYRLD